MGKQEDRRSVHRSRFEQDQSADCKAAGTKVRTGRLSPSKVVRQCSLRVEGAAEEIVEGCLGVVKGSERKDGPNVGRQSKRTKRSAHESRSRFPDVHIGSVRTMVCGRVRCVVKGIVEVGLMVVGRAESTDAPDFGTLV